MIRIICPVCGSVVKIKKISTCPNCDLIIELDTKKAELDLASKVTIICEEYIAI